jgi:hypothetical protein
MDTDIFIKSYAKDFPWLKNCLRSISERCSGFRRTIILVPMLDLPAISTWGLTREVIVGVSEPAGKGYDIQQCYKMEADKYTDAELIMFFDSDLYAVKDINPKILNVDGKPTIYMTKWEKLTDKEEKKGATMWREVMEHIMKQSIPCEFMRRHPFVYPRWLLKSFRDYIEREFKFSIWEYFVGGKCKYPLSEFNLLGAFAWVFYKSKFNFVDTDSLTMPDPLVYQFWSHGGPGYADNHNMLLKHGLTIT